ncbi:MAG: hypothetical protein F4Z18_08045 [Caldilineaceae bacterium SB0666_bin_21]|nr:hypothetical protein [Caldilineaceae bacterium SB0666_bin_21]
MLRITEGDDATTVDAGFTVVPLPIRLFDPAQSHYWDQMIFVGTISKCMNKAYDRGTEPVIKDAGYEARRIDHK